MSLFEHSMALTPAGSGRYDGAVETAWNGPVSPNGGVLAAMLTRAVQAELGPDGPPPRTVAAQYLDAPAGGPVGIAVEILRRGRRVAAADTRMYQAERLICQATVLCSATRADALRLTRPAPQRSSPEATPLLEFDAIPGAPRIFHQLDVRVTDGGVPFSRSPEAVSGGWLGLRDDPAPLDPARLVAMCDLWWPAVFPLSDGPVGVPTLQLTVHLRTVDAAVPGPAFALFRSEHVTEGHVEETGELWSRDGRLLAESRQLALTLGLDPRA
jgi:acyl-CoA thioesterase